MSTETALAIIEIKNPLQVFSTPQGLDPVIDSIEKESTALHADISTEEGRDTIRSLAFKIARSKTALDKMGKDLTEDQRKQIDAVNAERKRAWERLEKLQHDVRKPLTDWETAEEKRVENHESALLEIDAMSVFMNAPTSKDIELRIQQFKNLPVRDWQEFGMRADYKIKTIGETLSALLLEITKREQEATELERLRREDAERKQREYEEKIAREAADKAKAEAERIANEKAESERLKTEQEQQRMEREKQDALDRAAKAESDRLAAIESARIAADKAESDRIAAAERAKEDSEAAVERERQRAAAEKKKQDDELAAREADKEHRKKINNEAMSAIMAILNTAISPSDQAKAVITAIAKGEIPHVKIGY